MGYTNPHLPLPVLIAGTPVLTRDDGRLHVGCDPSTALIVRLEPPAVPEAVAQLLTELRRPRTRAQLGGRLRAAGLTASSFTELLDALVAAGKAAVPDAAATPLRVRIHGCNELAYRLAIGVQAAGLVVVADPLGPSSLTRFEHLDCQLLVLADRLVVDPAVRLGLMTAGVPHLPVVVQDGAGVIGPLVLPGHSSCLQCMDLHRSAADPEWPTLAARLAAVPSGADPETVALTAMIACQEVVGLARRLADPRGAPPQTLGRILRVRPQPAGTSLVAAPQHDDCPCGQPIATRSAVRRVHYPRGERKDCVERDHTGTGPPQCEAGSAPARHGGASGSRIR